MSVHIQNTTQPIFNSRFQSLRHKTSSPTPRPFQLWSMEFELYFWIPQLQPIYNIYLHNFKLKVFWDFNLRTQLKLICEINWSLFNSWKRTWLGKLSGCWKWIHWTASKTASSGQVECQGFLWDHVDGMLQKFLLLKLALWTESGGLRSV